MRELKQRELREDKDLEISNKTSELKEYIVKQSGILNPLLQKNTEHRASLADIIGGGRQRVIETGPLNPFEHSDNEVKFSPWGTMLNGPWSLTPKMAEALASPTPLNFWPAIDTFTKAFSGFAAKPRPSSSIVSIDKVPNSVDGLYSNHDETSSMNISGFNPGQPGGGVSSQNGIELTSKQMNE